MSPRKTGPGKKQRTAKDEAALQSAIKKQTKRGKGAQVNRSIGARLRRAWKESA